MELIIPRPMRLFVPVLLATLATCRAPMGNSPVTAIPAGAIDVAWNDAGAVRIAHSYNSGLRQSVRTVIGNDADWQAVWRMYAARLGGPPPAPAIDFTRYEVLVAALGERTSGGYDISISRIASTSDHLYVELVSTRPSSACGVTAALTEPVDIVRIPRAHAPVMFIEQSAQLAC